MQIICWNYNATVIIKHDDIPRWRGQASPSASLWRPMGVDCPLLGGAGVGLFNFYYSSKHLSNILVT